MLLPITIAFAFSKPISDNILNARINTLLNWAYLEDVSVHIKRNGNCGLIFINSNKIEELLSIPISFELPTQYVVSNYIPLGAGRIVHSTTFKNGSYLQHLSKSLKKSPRLITNLAPPFALYDLDYNAQTMHIFNDYRGFGRIYQYTGDFGFVWSNKIDALGIISGFPMEIDESAWTEVTAAFCFYRNATGYKNTTLLPQATQIHINTKDNSISHLQVFEESEYTDALHKVSNQQVQDTANAFRCYFKDLYKMTPHKPNIYLTGGRDSRVVAAYALKTAPDTECVTYRPPELDVRIASELLKKFDVEIPHKVFNIREKIKETFNHTDALEESLIKIMRTLNHDSSIKLYCQTHTSDRATIEGLKLTGAQGEIAHAVFYPKHIWEKEQAWQINQDGESPVQAHLSNYFQSFLRVWGMSESAKKTVQIRLQNEWITKGLRQNIKGLYLVDYRYLITDLNRQWHGAEGIGNTLVPLTLFEYTKYGFGQPLSDKLECVFTKNIIHEAMPEWENIPFLHDYPREQRTDFYKTNPTYWENQRGQEVVELIHKHSNILHYFDLQTVLGTFEKMSSTEERKKMDNTYLTIYNQTAQKILWTIAFYKKTNLLNKKILNN